MRCVPNSLGWAVMAVALWLAPGVATAARGDADAVRQAEATVERLRTELARVSADVARLKGAHSMRNDYRLRERMADAEALARRLTSAEAGLRVLRGEDSPAGAPIVAPPPASPHDGSVELVAKADLLVDQARKLEGEANTLAKAAQELRSRRVMRRKAQSWERDPFAGLETSRRSVAATAPASKSAASSAPATDSGSRSAGSNGATGSAAAPSGGSGPTLSPVVTPPPPTATADSSERAGTKTTAASDGAVAAKSSPIAPSGFADRQAVERRLYLDPATAAELRQALGPGGAALDPEALERGAAALRARARSLQAEAQSLRARSRTP